MSDENKNYKFPFKEIIVIIGALIYFLSPIDLVPDVVFGFGQIDDIILGVYAFKQFKNIINDYADYKMSKSKPKNEHQEPIDIDSKTIEDEN